MAQAEVTARVAGFLEARTGEGRPPSPVLYM
jgi:hypothetical protein